jgi:hypothetical protein
VLQGNALVLPDTFQLDMDAALAVMEHAFSLGCNLFDTAIVPEYGDAEYKLGRFAERVGRERIVISDKARFYDGNELYQAVHTSCETLGTCADLYFVHQVDGEHEETVFARGGALDALAELKAEGKILIFEHPTTKSSNDRVEGFADTIEENGNFEIVGRMDYAGQLEIAMPLMIDELKKGVEFDVVFSINDVGALGVMAALKDYGKLDGISVLGVDGAPEAKSMIKEKIMLATSAQYPSEIGQNAVDQLYNMIEGRPVEKKIKVSVNLISEENINEFSTKGWQ